MIKSPLVLHYSVDQNGTRSKLSGQFCSILNSSAYVTYIFFHYNRALNQALGRCIRHKGDWGAILLVDDRFAKTPRYVNQLSKWARASIRHYDYFAPMLHYLNEFTSELVKEDAAALLAGQHQALLQSTHEALLSIGSISITSPPPSVRPNNALLNTIPDELLEDNSSTRSS
jgi:Fanconi anemia group J protein